MDSTRPDQRSDNVFPVDIHWKGGEESVRVGKLLCIGRNYAKHAAEMRSEVPEIPMVFLKPSSAVIRGGGRVVLPKRSKDVHHEVELVAVIGKGGRNIDEAEALEYVAGYAVGLDMTARDLQQEAKDKRHPWSVAKGFDTFAPLGEIIPKGQVEDVQDLPIGVVVNGETRQEGSTRDMIFTVAELISYCSSIFTLYPGDLIYTGTPDGVGPVQEGDTLIAQIDDWPELRVDVVSE